MSGEQTVGSIVGMLRLDADQFHREITKAMGEVDALDGKNVDVKVTAETTRAEAGLARVEAEASKLDRTNAKVDTSSRNAGRGLGAMATAVITLGPALVPLAVGATGLAAAFGGMGAAGVLAIVGIRNEMKAGTSVGNAYTVGLDALKGNLTDLGKIAARNVLGPFQGTVADLQTKMPTLSSMIGDLSTVTGKTAGALTGGLVAAFVALAPLIRDASVYVLNLSQRFQDAMSGGGVTAFGDYVRSVFPQVMASVESIVEVAVRLVAAFAPLGGGTLSMIKLFADVISAIDPTALAAVATAAGAVFIGFRSWQGLSGLVKGLGDALGGVETMSTRAATGMRALNIASGVIGVALTGLSIAMTMFSTNTTDAQGATDSLTDALIASNGAITDSVRLAALKNAQDSGAIDNARMLGISTQQVVDAYVGQGKALGDLSSQRDAALAKQQALVDAGKADASTMSDVENAYLNLQNQLEAAGIKWDSNKVKVQQHNDAVKQAPPVLTAAQVAMQGLAAQYGTSTTVMQAVTDAQKKSAVAAETAAVQMQQENNAAGILKQSLDALAGKSLSSAQAQNAFDSSLANMGDHITATGKKIHFTTTSIKDMSAASVSLRGQLLGQVTAAEQTAEAYGQMKGSAEAGRTKLIALRTQIINNAVAHGVDRKAVTDYVDSFLKIPKSVPPTKLDVDKAAAQKKAQEFIGVINGVPTWHNTTVTANTAGAVANVHALSAAIAGVSGKTVTISTVYKTFGAQAAASAAQAARNPGAYFGRAQGGDIPGFAGGTLVGPGTGTSDSIMAMVAQTGRLLRVSAGEFVSTDASRRRNHAALEAGNKGATLKVSAASNTDGALVAAIAGLNARLDALGSWVEAGARRGVGDRDAIVRQTERQRVGAR